MKVLFFVTVLLFGCSNAKPHSAKRSPTCSGFPKELSGRLYSKVVKDSGIFNNTVTSDTHFQIDWNRQLFQANAIVQGESYVIFEDYKNHKSYVVYTGGCLASDSNGDLPSLPDVSDAELVASGTLGLNGASVNLYSFNDNKGSSGVVTLEGGDQCLPVTYGTKENGSVSTGIFLDLQTTVDPEKLQIPEQCLHSNADVRRALPAILHTARLKKAIKRGFPWIETKKRGFPWIDDASTRKRGFPWIEDASTLKRGFPWIP